MSAPSLEDSVPFKASLEDSVPFKVGGFHSHGYCKCGDATLYYSLFGSGHIKVVLLMGIATSGYAWKNQIEYLVQFPQYQICVFDNRGSGRTVTPPGRLTTTLMAQDVVQLIDFLKWDKVHIVGNSLGGMIAQEFALLVPHRLLSLTLIATHAGGWKAYVPPWQVMLSVIRHPFARTPKDQIRVLMEAVFSSKFLSSPGKKEHFSIIDGEYTTILDFYAASLYKYDALFAKENLVYLFAQQLSAVLTHHVSASRLEKLKDKFPVLFITGTGDKVVNTSHTDFLHSVGALYGPA